MTPAERLAAAIGFPGGIIKPQRAEPKTRPVRRAHATRPARPQRDWLRLGLDPLTVAEIATRVAELYGLSLWKLTGRQRAACIVGPRHLAMWLCCHLTNRTLHQIGAAFGKRDHTTVVHARDKLDRMHEQGRIADPGVVWADLIAGEDDRRAA